jgi:glyoxylase-like metal-dependent hydrolase (beta-lactamase superfamily II)
LNIVNVGYLSTNYYVLADTAPRLLVDLGWPGTLPRLRNACERMGVELSKIPYLLATHYHPDHAGLAQDLKRMGAKLIVLDTQVGGIPLLKTYVKPKDGYVEIDTSTNIVISAEESRAFLSRIGVQGQIVSTPGHSDDCVTLLLDDGSAFTGDLQPMFEGVEETEATRLTRESWERIMALGAKTIYPGHGPARSI